MVTPPSETVPQVLPTPSESSKLPLLVAKSGVKAGAEASESLLPPASSFLGGTRLRFDLLSQFWRS